MPNDEEWISLQEFMRRKKIGKEVAFQLLASGKNDGTAAIEEMPDRHTDF